MRPVASEPSLELHASAEGVAARIVGCTALTEENCTAFGRLLAEAIDAHPGQPFALDLANIAYLTSFGLAKIITASVRLRQSSGGLVLRNLQPNVREIFAVTKLDRIIDIPSPT